VNKIKSLLLPVFSLISLLFLTTPVLAGGGNAYINVTETDDPHWMIVRAYVNPANVNCQGMTVSFNFLSPEDGDIVNGSNGGNTSTTSDAAYETVNGKQYLRCSAYAKVYAKNFEMNRLFRVSFKGSNIDEYRDFAVSFDQYNYPNYLVLLPWEEIPIPSSMPIVAAPTMIYPQDNQTIDLEGAYLFKVKPAEGATGYLFGLFQDNVMVYENYRDSKTLSSNGEFALWEANPAHVKFHQGNIKVMIRALVNKQWTDAREITVNLKPRGGNTPVQTTTALQQTPNPLVVPVPPVLKPPQQIIVVSDSSASAALQNKVDELQKKLEESQQKQSVLEQQLNQIINWIKSIFPFFK